MSRSFNKDPVRIHCPCADSPADAPVSLTDRDSPPSSPEDAAEAADQTRRVFDPTDPRAKYSLHPLAYLYFCQECQAIRCPRCVQEEIVSAFCPMCLFEVPLTSIKADGNRSTSLPPTNRAKYMLTIPDVCGIVFSVRFVFRD
jgi:dynactin-4